MMRGFYITGIVLGVVLFFITAFYMEEVQHARWNYYDYDYNYNSYDSYSNYDYSDDDEYTVDVGLITAFFFFYFIFLEIMTFIKLKTTTMKVLTIIGISVSGIMLVWDLIMIASPSHISFDEVGAGWIIYAMIQIAFCIVGTVHAFRKKA